MSVEKTVIISSKLDVSKLTPLKPIPYKANIIGNSSGRKTPRIDPYKQQRRQKWKDRVEDAKKSLEKALFEKENIEELSRSLAKVLKEQDYRIENAIAGLLTEEK